MKKILAIILSLAMIVSLQSSIAFAEETNSQFLLTEFEETPDSVYFEHLDNNVYNTSNQSNMVMATAALPSSCDISTSPYFPPIGNQGSVGSCVAYSITYSQFTYEANKLNNIPSNSNTSIYSPQWVYYACLKKNATVNDKGEIENIPGINPSRAYDFLTDHGALKLCDNPYITTYQMDMPLPTDVAKMREALNTRISSWSSYYIPATGTPITNNKDTDLIPIKNLLNSGKILRASSHFNFDYAKFNGKNIKYRCNYTPPNTSGHSFVIVGYDDNIYYDVNKNGIIEAGEKGAFKIANSWGTTDSSSVNGYSWILYDTLNYETSIPGSWESSFSSIRRCAFKYGESGNYNWLTAINVENKNVNFVGEVKLTNTKRDDLNISLQNYSINNINTIKTHKTNFSYEKPNENSTGLMGSYTLLFDFDNIESNIDIDSNGKKWGIRLTDKINAQVSASYVKITDNLGNLIKNLYSTHDSPYLYQSNINLAKGDVDMNGSISSLDALTIQRYIVKLDDLSNVQKYLADFNNDGVVNSLDSQSILDMITA